MATANNSSSSSHITTALDRPFRQNSPNAQGGRGSLQYTLSGVTLSSRGEWAAPGVLTAVQGSDASTCLEHQSSGLESGLL